MIRPARKKSWLRPCLIANRRTCRHTRNKEIPLKHTSSLIAHSSVSWNFWFPFHNHEQNDECTSEAAVQRSLPLPLLPRRFDSSSPRGLEIRNSASIGRKIPETDSPLCLLHNRYISRSTTTIEPPPELATYLNTCSEVQIFILDSVKNAFGTCGKSKRIRSRC